MNPLARWLLIGGTLALFAGPGAGMLATTISMTRAFSVLGKSGVAEPKELAQSIGDTLIFTSIGFFIGILGALVLVTGVIVWLVNRKPSNQAAVVETLPPASP